LSDSRDPAYGSGDETDNALLALLRCGRVVQDRVMKLSKTLFLVPVASLLFLGAIGSGACSSSVSVTIPTETTPPDGVTFVGGKFGGSCSGDVYVEAGTGWAFCDDDTWAYTTTDPSTDGFTPFSGSGDGGPEEDGRPDDDGGQGDDTGPVDGGQGDDTSADDGGQGDDTSVDDGGQGDDSGVDDGGQGDGSRGDDGGQGDDSGQGH
jgi:hypothetical protein